MRDGASWDILSLSVHRCHFTAIAENIIKCFAENVNYQTKKCKTGKRLCV